MGLFMLPNLTSPRGIPAPPVHHHHAAWSTVTFADIPPECLDRVLEEVLKGMLFHQSAAAQQSTKTTAPRRKTSPRSDTSSADVAPPPPSLYARVMASYNAVMRQFAASAASSDAPRQDAESEVRKDEPSSVANATFASRRSIRTLEVDGGLLPHASLVTPIVVSRPFGLGSVSSVSATLSLPAAGPAQGAGSGMASLSDRRVQQLERIAASLREENSELGMKLDDLHAAHRSVHQELNASYKEYDALQRRLIDVLGQKNGSTSGGNS